MAAESELHQSTLPPPNPGPDIATARHRRSIAQSRTARNNITNLVDAIKVSKPPKPPSKLNTANATNATRRRALIPLAEGRTQLEARIRSLEDTVSARDEAVLRLKRQLGKTLFKRRSADKERDSLTLRVQQTASLARSHHSVALSTKTDLHNLIDSVTISVQAANELLSSIASSTSGVQNTDITNLQISLTEISDAIDTAKAKLSTYELPAIPSNVNDGHSTLCSSKKPPRPASIATQSDEDARSCASYASSILGDDREAQIETLIELVEILDVKLSTAPLNQTAIEIMNRAKDTISNEQSQNENAPLQPSQQNESDFSQKRELITNIVNEVVREYSNVANDHQDTSNVIDVAEVTRSVTARVELDEARQTADTLQKRVLSLERTAQRAVQLEELIDQNARLQRDLDNAKETITRLIRERGPTRRLSSGQPSPFQTPMSTPVQKPLRGEDNELSKRFEDEDDDRIKRVITWQQNHPVARPNAGNVTNLNGEEQKAENNEANHSKNSNTVEDGEESSEKSPMSNGWNPRLPDRDENSTMEGVLGTNTSTSNSTVPPPARRRRATSLLGVDETTRVCELPPLPNVSSGMVTHLADDGGSVPGDLDSVNGSINNNEDAASSQSLPIAGILRRHNSFIHSHGEGIHGIFNLRNIFRTSPSPIDGLRDLLQE